LNRIQLRMGPVHLQVSSGTLDWHLLAFFLLCKGYHKTPIAQKNTNQFRKSKMDRTEQCICINIEKLMNSSNALEGPREGGRLRDKSSEEKATFFVTNKTVDLCVQPIFITLLHQLLFLKRPDSATFIFEHTKNFTEHFLLLHENLTLSAS